MAGWAQSDTEGTGSRLREERAGDGEQVPQRRSASGCTTLKNQCAAREHLEGAEKLRDFKRGALSLRVAKSKTPTAIIMCSSDPPPYFVEKYQYRIVITQRNGYSSLSIEIKSVQIKTVYKAGGKTHDLFHLIADVNLQVKRIKKKKKQK